MSSIFFRTLAMQASHRSHAPRTPHTLHPSPALFASAPLRAVVALVMVIVMVSVFAANGFTPTPFVSSIPMSAVPSHHALAGGPNIVCGGVSLPC